ncbi:MAG: hypothetical protein DRI80_06630, partial [Chloroflexota bacterium]
MSRWKEPVIHEFACLIVKGALHVAATGMVIHPKERELFSYAAYSSSHYHIFHGALSRQMTFISCASLK